LKLYIAPLGTVDERVLARICEVIEEQVGVECATMSPLENPRYAYDERRCQYDCKAVLERIKKKCPEDALGILGVTHVDLFLPVLKYLFGMSEVGGKCAAISLYRLRPEFNEESPDEEKLFKRVEKTALHEIGHPLGVTHCRDPRCVMRASTTVEHTDAKEPRFCPSCKELVRWELRLRSLEGKRPYVPRK